jgi:LCP family protein required for cell wall assembly
MFEDKYPHKKISFWQKARIKALVAGLIFMVASVGIFVASGYDFSLDITPEKNSTVFGQVIGSVSQFLIEPDRPIAGEVDGTVNLLLLGVGGNGYYGATITDTIMVASIKLPETNGGKTKISLISIPRDLAVELPGGTRWHKINEAYVYGELRQEGLGSAWVSEIVEEWLNIPIHYFGVVDFVAFRDGIDALGGVDVEVENSFTDYSYPDYNFGTQVVNFDKGVQKMNGERALQFARSRKGNNGEGSDFMRARRQQKIMWAVKERVTKLNLIRDIKTVKDLYDSLTGTVDTDMELWQIKRVYDMVKGVDQNDIFTHTLDPRTGLVCSAIDEETQLYVLRMCEGVSFNDIHDFAEKRFEE